MKNFYFLIAAMFIFSGAGAQIINFPDAILKAKLLQTYSWNAGVYDINGVEILIDANNDGEIEVNEALAVSRLTLGSNPTDEQNYITDATGLEYFTNLQSLRISDTNLTTLNLPALLQLNSLSCSYSELESVNISQVPNLKELSLGYNKIPSLDAINLQNTTQIERLNLGNCLISGPVDLTGFTQLKFCSIGGNSITAIDMTGLVNLEDLTISYNNLTSIDLTSLSNFKYLVATANQLTDVDVSQNPRLTHLYLRYNQLTTIDLSHNPNFFYLNIRDNNLSSMFIKNGHGDTIELAGNPNLAYICGDEIDLTNGMLLSNPLTQVNSYCSFVPGGTFYTVAGSNSYDSSNDGCGAGDISIPHIRVTVTNGTTSGAVIANNSGNYSIPITAGNYTLTPSFEHSEYFNFTPPQSIVSFPVDASPYTQHFCVTANGVHPDLEVTVLPNTPARPGFDATYKVMLNNKGNQTQSGSIHLNYDDAVLDFVSSSPPVTSQSPNVLVLDFDGLAPFQTASFIVTFNANSPTEAPALNVGDLLNFTASIVSAASDETPDDNIFTLRQTVINSLDPNDKTCLEGATITPEMVGKYVHYMIRFENTGTANAENIVVKDMIDATKFDVNSLVPLDGSHEFVTRINGNKVEFIFENINLPFDDANNDGYVAFKIKTKPTLVLGDTFSNTASIYFDYNFPIVTEPAVTVIAVLAKQDFVFDSYFRIYPNPANDVLKIESKQNIEVQSISIYNTLGQLVLVVPNAKTTKAVDVSGLQTGNYFIKIDSDKGTSNAKFLKD